MSRLQQLQQTLSRRIEIVTDHSWRDRAPESHLDALRQNANRLSQLHHELRPELDPRLEHFLSRGSYSKALDFLRRGSR